MQVLDLGQVVAGMPLLLTVQPLEQQWRVLTVRAVAGNFCGALLGYFGADVIKASTTRAVHLTV